MSDGLFLKDPGAVLDYSHDWSDFLDNGETISTSTWSVTPTGLTVDSDSETGTAATVWLSGGTAGRIYHVTNTITTSQSRTDQRTIVIRVEQT